jgi:glycosyltransferase involved in cell wall biosynthesis
LKAVCIENERGRPKRGTILRCLFDGLERFSDWTPVCSDRDLEPDLYVFEKYSNSRRYPDKPVIIHAENLIGPEWRIHQHGNCAHIVYNSNWLKTLYEKTFGAIEVPSSIIIPAHQIFDVPDEQASEFRIVCCSKWWKRPYKRLGLIVEAFNELVSEPEYGDVYLDVFGWLDGVNRMPYVNSFPRYWPVSRHKWSHPNITYHQKSFNRNVYPKVLGKSSLFIHLSAIDSGPQVVAEALACGIPCLVSNNMGGQEWVKQAGAQYGKVLDLDAHSETVTDVAKLSGDSWGVWKSVSSEFRRVCHPIQDIDSVVIGMRQMIDECRGRSQKRLPIYSECAMDTIIRKWCSVFEQLTG